jgi:hypothetical protein
MTNIFVNSETQFPSGFDFSLVLACSRCAFRCICCNQTISFTCQAAKEKRKHTCEEDDLCFIAAKCEADVCCAPRVGGAGHLFCNACKDECFWNLYADGQCRWCYYYTETAQYKEDDGEEEGAPVPRLLPCAKK